MAAAKRFFCRSFCQANRSRRRSSKAARGLHAPELEQCSRASAERVEPGCPYVMRCGGCHYQHIDYAAQLRYKTEILRETLRRTAKFELQDDIVVHAAEPWAYRNRTRMHVRHQPEFALRVFSVRIARTVTG